MRIRRAIIVPAILTLGTTGSILATSAIPLVAAQTSSAYVLAATTPRMPDLYFHG